MSLTQIFSAAAYGEMLNVVPRSVRGDSRALTQLIVCEGISHTAATPSEYRLVQSWRIRSPIAI